MAPEVRIVKGAGANAAAAGSSAADAVVVVTRGGPLGAWGSYGYLHLLRVLLVEPMVMLVLRGRCHRADLLAAELLDDVAALTSMLDRPRDEIAALAGGGRLDPLFTFAPVHPGGSGIRSGRSGELSPHPAAERRIARLQGGPPWSLPAQAQGAPLVGLALVNVILLGGLVLVTLVSYLYAAVCALTAWIAASGLALVGRLLL